MSQIGQTLVDSSTTSIASIINDRPQEIVYSLSAQSNTVTATQSNFALDTSKFKLNVEVQLPLYGTASNFSFVDTLKNPLYQQSTGSTSSVSNYIESALIRLYSSNGFPMDVGLQVYFVDSTYKKILDSLISTPSQYILKSGTVNPSNGMVTAPTVSITDIPVSSASVTQITNAKYIILKARASTTNGGSVNVNFYSYYRLLVELGIQVQGNVKIDPATQQ